MAIRKMDFDGTIETIELNVNFQIWYLEISIFNQF